MNWLVQRKYRVLLVALLLLIVVYPMLHGMADTWLLFDVLLALVFAAGFLAVFTEGRFRLLALLLGVPTLVGTWTGYVLPGLPRPPFVVAFHVVAFLFLAFTVAMILRAGYREAGVSADTVYGAFCGYLLVGLAFGHLYCLVESVRPGSFRGGEEVTAHLQDESHQRFELSYFSFVTLTTIGYGDITPASEAARGLAVVEAITGQFYIAVLIAELIGKRVGHAIGPS